jgi:hypothetical protein
LKNSKDLTAEKFLLLFKLDAMNMFSRILYRKPEYITIFALKRTREHFEDIFKNRYRDVTMEEISHCSTDTIVALNNFYEETESIRWYLITTEDMPNGVSDELDRRFVTLETLHNTLIIHIDAELGIESDIQVGSVKELSFQGESESEINQEEFSEFDETDDAELVDFSDSDDLSTFQDVSDTIEN